MLKAITTCCAIALAGALAAPAAHAAEGQQLAFLHEPHAHTMHHSRGCFVTLTPTDHTRGIRHWRNPCPHQHRKHMNPFHHGYQRLHPHH